MLSAELAKAKEALLNPFDVELEPYISAIIADYRWHIAYVGERNPDANPVIALFTLCKPYGDR